MAHRLTTPSESPERRRELRAVVTTEVYEQFMCWKKAFGQRLGWDDASLASLMAVMTKELGEAGYVPGQGPGQFQARVPF